LKKKTILITGVLGGIGASLAKFFKDKDFIVYGIDLYNQEGYEYIDVLFSIDLNQYCVDIEYRNFHSEILNNEIGSLDVLINNAAVQILGSFKDIKFEDWIKTLNVNLNAAFLLSQLFAEKLENNKGSIINIGSIHNQLTKPSFVSYATSKSALVGLTKSMAVDLKNKIKVNCISPAAIETDMLKAGFDNNEEAISQLKFLHPTQTIGKPEEVAEICYFLVNQNITFLHGANISLDGGISSVLHDIS
jgi:NAD(P)-dependent dehydrogenase (short-subunit alcohol dehydrogenase family)